MSTLVDFLLARIAEYETAAAEIPAASNWRMEVPGPDGRYVVLPQRAANFRMLAECEANRRIIEWTVSVEGALRREGECHDAPLRLLALPYADHPDWREEWRASDS